VGLATIVAAIAAFWAPGLTQAAPRAYTVVDLGTLGGSTSEAYGLNDDGVVVGRAAVAGDIASHAFVYRDGLMDDLGVLAGGTNSAAYGVNSRGQIAGTSDELISTWPGCDPVCTPAVVPRAFVADASGLRDLGGQPNGSFPFRPPGSYAYAINDEGTVAGGFNSASQDIFASFWTNGIFNFVFAEGWATSINSSGELAGVGPHGVGSFMYTGGQVTRFITPISFNPPWASINDRDEVAFTSGEPLHETHAFLYRDGVETDLGTLGGTTSEAFGIDHKGDVVGSAQIAGDAATHAFLYRRGQMTDLNDLIPETSGWILTSARAINKFSEIVGAGEIDGHTHAFLLTPTRGQR
jgi:probable HAF family extracellular repeat protein